MKNRVIKNIENFILSPKSTIESISFFLINIRLFLEHENMKTKYPVLNLYCNWLVHTYLNGKLIPETIKQIAAAFNDFEDHKDLIVKINKSIQTRQFIIELKEILFLNKLSIKNDEFWIIFLSVLINELKYRPLLLNPKAAIKVDEINFSVYGIQLTNNKEKIVIEVLSNELDSQKKHLFFDFVIQK